MRLYFHCGSAQKTKIKKKTIFHLQIQPSNFIFDEEVNIPLNFCRKVTNSFLAIKKLVFYFNCARLLIEKSNFGLFLCLFWLNHLLLHPTKLFLYIWMVYCRSNYDFETKVRHFHVSFCWNDQVSLLEHLFTIQTL